MRSRLFSPVWVASIGALVASFASALVVAQPPGFAAPPRSAREAAQVDLTGYWVALVTEDWLWRMITAPSGDATSVPLNQQGQRVAAQWSPNRDQGDEEACRPFGAAGLMRMPLRLHITWDDDETLEIATDAGRQTRSLKFDSNDAVTGEHSWQGLSAAEWTTPVGGFDLKALMRGGGVQAPAGPPMGSLKVVTTNLRAGYLRKNGIPYSENTELTEYFSRVSAFGNDYLTVLSIVHDPMYLNQDFVTSSHFKRETDDSNWSDAPCRTAPPLAAEGTGP